MNKFTRSTLFLLLGLAALANAAPEPAKDNGSAVAEESGASESVSGSKEPVKATPGPTEKSAPDEATAARLAEAKAAYKNKEYDKARKIWQPLAEAGYSNAQFNLGVLYAQGLGVRQDYEKARKFYEKAAAQGYKDAEKALQEIKE